MRKILMSAALALLLAACGGGTEPPEGMKSTDPPDCKAKPESCR